MAVPMAGPSRPGRKPPRMDGTLDREDIEALLGTRPLAKTEHFALHGRPGSAVLRKLSTEDAPSRDHSVDNYPERFGFATLVPKRHARRATTRNLIKRQVRASLQDRRGGLGTQQLLIRMRAPLDLGQFPSAASRALRTSVRAELDMLLSQTTAPSCR